MLSRAYRPSYIKREGNSSYLIWIKHDPKEHDYDFKHFVYRDTETNIVYEEYNEDFKKMLTWKGLSE